MENLSAQLTRAFIWFIITMLSMAFAPRQPRPNGLRCAFTLLSNCSIAPYGAVVTPASLCA